jgi:ABC-2 type transport system permease protein
MNPVNRFFVNILLYPSAFYARFGLDKSLLRAILSIKLLMDERRPNNWTTGRGGHTEQSSSPFWMALTSLFFGLLYLYNFYLGPDYVTHLCLYFGFYILMLSMMLISDFTALLLDVRDNNIILPKPIDDRTLVAARLLHILVHILKLVIPMLLPCTIYLGIAKGWHCVPLFVLLCLLATFFSIFLINALYILLLRAIRPARFKNLISTMQIVIAISAYAGIQWVLRSNSESGIQSFADRAAFLVYPPYWFACAFSLILEANVTTIHLISTFLAFILPFIGIYVVIKYLAPHFNERLAMISGSESTLLAVEATQIGSKITFSEKLSGYLCRKGAEQVGFRFAMTMMFRSREFKLKVYPSIGYVLVILIMPFLTGSIKLDSEDTLSFNTLIFLAYALGMILYPAIAAIMLSEKYRAAWMFWIVPLEKPGELAMGAIKAVLAKFLLLPSLLLLSTGIGVFGPSILPDLLLAISNQVLILLLVSHIQINALPFSKPVAKSDGGQTLATMIFLFLGGILAVLHYILFHNPWLVTAFTVLPCAAIWALMEGIRSKGLGIRL